MKFHIAYGKSVRRCSKPMTATMFVAIGLRSIALAGVEPATSPQQVDSGVGHAERAIIPVAQHAWQSFLKLAAKSNAIVTVDDLENAFGRKSVDQGGYHRILGMPVTLFVSDDRAAPVAYPNRSVNYVDFDFDGSMVVETCIRRDQAISDLLAVGWTLHSHTPGQPPQGDIREVLPPDLPYGSYIFLKGDQGVIRLAYSERTNCATKLIMESDKLEFDRRSDEK